MAELWVSDLKPLFLFHDFLYASMAFLPSPLSTPVFGPSPSHGG